MTDSRGAWLKQELAKPLGIKAYGSIPHLPGSRLGPGDHHCHDGQAKIATVKTRDRYDTVTVTAKLDGSCCSVARIDGVIVPLGRAGYLASTSKYEQHQLFAQWVYANQGRFMEALEDGERMVGEWLAQAHGTRYALKHEPFVPFDIMRGTMRLPVQQLWDISQRLGFTLPTPISLLGPLSIEDAMKSVEHCFHGELDPPEGAVWRVERKGEFDFITKFVRPDKVDGAYLPEVSGKEAVWNWRPE